LEGHSRNSHISGDYLHIPFFHDDATTTAAAAAAVAALKKIHFHLPAKQKAKCALSSFTISISCVGLASKCFQANSKERMVILFYISVKVHSPVFWLVALLFFIFNITSLA
jgi:hypothetical protein